MLAHMKWPICEKVKGVNVTDLIESDSVIPYFQQQSCYVLRGTCQLLKGEKKH